MKFRIAIVSPVFSPEPVVSARTSSDLAQELAKTGNLVTVITSFPNRPAGKLYDGYHRKLWTYEHAVSGFEIVRLFSFFSQRSDILSRFLENLSFGIASAVAIYRLEKPDVIYANTWPIFAQGLLAIACKLRRIPFVLSVQDLYPESLFLQERGFKKNSSFYRLLHWLDMQIAKNCAGLIVISEQFKQTYVHDRGIPENKIAVIPNWIDVIPAVSGNNDFRKKHNIPEHAFLVVYGGNIGVAAGVEHLIEAFQTLKQENIYFLIAGAGGRLPECLKQIQEYGLERVKVHSPWQLKDTYSVLGSADLCILPTQGEQSLASVPSKLLAYLMAGRPVLAVASAESETARIITTSGAGWVISKREPEVIGKHIREISQLSSADLSQYGDAGRRYVLEYFSKNKNLPKMIEVLIQQGTKHKSLANGLIPMEEIENETT